VKITAEMVSYLAELARLRLEPDEAERMQRDLDAILGYVDKLGEIDTSDVPPTAHVLDMAARLREDRVSGVLPVSEAVRNAPEHTESAMVVPKVIE
jgi:aspartyl-tRNA(Asn)/glutamyl-tRNA(Gln) amidotransferase subunit C